MEVNVMDVRLMRSAALCSVVSALAGVSIALADPTITQIAIIDTNGGDMGGLYSSGAVTVAGGRAYVVDTLGGLHIVDVQTPTSPTVMGGVTTRSWATDVAVDGGVAYVADGYAGLTVLNVNNAAAPTIVGYNNTPGFSHGIVMNGQIACIADGWAGLVLMNVANPAAPSILGQLVTPGWVIGLARVGNLLYLAEAMNDGMSFNGLQIVDISNPSSPVSRSLFTTPSWARDVVVVNDLAYLACHDGLKIINVQNPTSPILVGACSTVGKAMDVVVEGNLAYVALGEGTPSGLQIVDIANPTSPVPIVSYTDQISDGNGLVLSQGLIYLASGKEGLRIFRYDADTTTSTTSTPDTSTSTTTTADTSTSTTTTTTTTGPKPHSADYRTSVVLQSPNWKIDTTELNRVLVLFRNLDGYHNDAGQPDKFAPGLGDRSGGFHAADWRSSPVLIVPNWKIDTTELNRVLVIWRNSNGYHVDPGLPDGYAPGAP